MENIANKTAEQLERLLIKIVFNPELSREFVGDEQNHPELDRVQLNSFQDRMFRNLEKRLSGQFGATLGLIEESFFISAAGLTLEFMASREFSNYREDINNSLEMVHLSLEQNLLMFLVNKFSRNPDFLMELEEIFLAELSLGLA